MVRERWSAFKRGVVRDRGRRASPAGGAEPARRVQNPGRPPRSFRSAQKPLRGPRTRRGPPEGGPRLKGAPPDSGGIPAARGAMWRALSDPVPEGVKLPETQ